jgi:hypothetical protein
MRYYIISETDVVQVNTWSVEQTQGVVVIIDRIKNLWSMDFKSWLPIDILNT